jgi:engulfment and cell motility protein 1
MSILAAVVSHPQIRGSGSSGQQLFGFRALKPAIGIYPQFLEMLVNRLSSADHALCANALQLINALMRDAISQDSKSKRSSERSNEQAAVRSPNLPTTVAASDEWAKFIKRLQDLGVIKSVYILMQSSALQDLAHPILEFQSLTKALLRKWREDKVDLERSDHRRALKSLHLASDPHPERRPSTKSDLSGNNKNTRGSRRHNPEKWRRLGFESEQPSQEFTETGFLGMMDLSDFVRKREDGFARLLLEQAGQPSERRCPVARASLAVTAILYEHFEVDKAEPDEAQARYAALESRSNFEKAFRPLLLQWSRLHTAGLNAFLRLWKTTGAEVDDFSKVEELVRILVEQVVGQAPRTKDIQEIEDEIHEFDYQRLRELQMELLELTYEDVWGHHLRYVGIPLPSPILGVKWRLLQLF